MNDLRPCRPLNGHATGSDLSWRVQEAAPSRREPLPRGTVTFAFTDIEASTRLLRRLGDGYGDVLGEHRRIIRRTFQGAGGAEIDRQGDAFFFAFQRARDGVAAAVEAQRAHAAAIWPPDARVRVRIGLHTGEPTVGAEGYLGIDVVKAARICKVARGGDTLLSEATRAIVGSALPEGVSVLAAGEEKLKDIDVPQPIYRLVIADLERGRNERPGRSALPADWEREIEQRFGSVGVRLAEAVGGRLADSVGAGMRGDGGVATRAVGKDGDLERLAARAAASLEQTLRAGASAAWKAAQRARREG